MIEYCPRCGGEFDDGDYDIAAAMLSIQAAMEKAQAHVDIELFYNSALVGRVTVHDIEGREDIIIPYGASLLVKTLPEAICKAALLAVMGE